MEKRIEDIDLASLLPDYAVEDINEEDISNESTKVEEKTQDFKLNNQDEQYTSFNLTFNNDINVENNNKSDIKIEKAENFDIKNLNLANKYKENKIKTYKSVNNFEFNDDELNILEEFNTKFNKIEENYNKFKYIIEKRASVEEDLRNIRTVYNQLDIDKKNIRLALVSLKSWYGNYKQDIINDLQNDINKMLNGFFRSKHKIMLKQDVQRGKSVVNMMEVNDKGESMGDIGVMLSGAERQMTGFLIQSSILSTLNSNFIILDEAFSSFGKDEVKLIPRLLENLDDMQMIVIEHKEEMFEDFPVKTIRIDNNEELGTHIVSIDE